MTSKEPPILIIGAQGQVGKALLELSDNAIGVGRKEIDLETLQFFSHEMAGLKPSAIINATAYTAVDKAEEEEIKAHQVNAMAPALLAAYCKAQNIPFVHYSTDYVFDGSGAAPWHEEDITSPLNAYGRSKLAGEKRIMETGGKNLIFRTSWVYSADGKNFLNTMLRLGEEREELRVVNDQWGAPTYAQHLAAATLEALENAMRSPRFPSGIYHLCGDGETNWQHFARQIFSLGHKHGLPLKIQKVHGVPTEEYPTPAARPRNSRLSCDKALKVLGVRLPHWEEALKEAMERRANLAASPAPHAASAAPVG